MRNEKTEQFKKLKDKRTSKEYEEWFLRYEPKGVDKKDNKSSNKKSKKSKRRGEKGSNSHTRKKR